MKDFVLTRLREPSTYTGIAALVGSLSFIPNAAEWAQIVIPAGTVIAGALAILLGEKAK